MLTYMILEWRDTGRLREGEEARFYILVNFVKDNFLFREGKILFINSRKKHFIASFRWALNTKTP